MAGVLDHGAESVTGGARCLGGDHAQDGLLLVLHVSGTAAHGTGGGAGAGLAARALTGGTDDRGVHGDVLFHTEHGVFEGHAHVDERVLSLSGAGLGAALARGARALEERFEDVREPEAGAGESPTEAGVGSVLVSGGVVHAPFLRVRQDVVRVGDSLELFGGVRGGIHVRVQFAGLFTVGALDLFRAGIPGHAQGFVVIAHDGIDSSFVSV